MSGTSLRREGFFATIGIVFLLLSASAFAETRPFAPVQGGFVGQAEEISTYAPNRVLVRLTPSAKRSIEMTMGRSIDSEGITATGSFELDTRLRRNGVQRLRPSYSLPQRADLARDLGVDRWMTLETDASVDPAQVVRDLADDPMVEVAHVDWRAFPATVPNDPMYPSQWGHDNTAQMLSYDWATYSHENGEPVGTVGFDANAEAAWSGAQGFGDANVVIAILDSGVDIDHPDLNLVAGYDFGDNDANPDDDSAAPGHGTACAGVAAAIAGNNLGVAGIAGGSSVMPVKVADSSGAMYFSYIQNAIYYAADSGADVISMSLGAAISSDPATDTALQYAHDAGAVILAATGNENASVISYPAVHDVVIGVGAASPCGDRKRSSSSRFEVNSGVNTDPNGYTCDGERWWGSNYGSTTPDDRGAVDIIAPTILPTTDIGGSGGYASGDYDMWFNGTSCATPYAAGVAALVISANPGFTPTQVRDALTSTAQDVVNVESGAGWDRYSGYGMVDAAAAVGAGGPVAPVADFTADATSGTVPFTVNFSDASSGAPTSWSWDFGDGGTSTAQNPSYTYAAAGTYTVALTVSNAVGSDTATKTDYVTVNAPAPPVADFAGTPTSGSFPLDVQFTDASSGVPTSWSWNFGDGGTSTAQNPSYTYAAIGTYTVTLTVSSPYGSDTATKVDYVTVTDVPQVITATAIADLPVLGSVAGSYVDTWAADGVAEVVTESLSDNHPRKTTSWAEHQWRFDVPSGDAVTLVARASRTSGDGDDFAFAWSTDQVNWNAAFTVASATASDYSVTLPAGTSGTVFVQVVDTDRSWDLNVLDAVSVDYLAFEVGGGTPSAPTADFSATPTSGSYPLAVQFTDASSGAPTSWNWDFGDGGTSTAQNPSHTYAAAGTYTVTLTATNEYGSDVATKADYVVVTEPGTGGDAIHVASISVTRKSAGPNVSGQATIVIVDANSAPVANATVTGVFTGPVGGTFSGVTAGDGSVFFETGKTKSPSGEWCFEVTDVTHASFAYDAAANVVTKACESGTVFAADSTQRLAGRTFTAAPNPFNPVTEIVFSMDTAGPVRLDVFDVRGRLVAQLVDEFVGAGVRSVTWQPDQLSSGVYFARLQTAAGHQVQRLVLLK